MCTDDKKLYQKYKIIWAKTEEHKTRIRAK